jgi:hypothetical protein
MLPVHACSGGISFFFYEKSAYEGNDPFDFLGLIY